MKTHRSSAHQQNSCPALAVLTPVYNDAGGLARTLESLRTQKVDFDWILVDDGSKEPVVIDDENLPFRIHCIRLDPNGGITAALNAGLQYILPHQYRWIARLDAGDEACPDRFLRQQKALENDPSLGAVGSWVECVDPAGNSLLIREMPASNEAIARRNKRASGMVHPAVTMRSETIRQVGMYREEYPAAEDFDMWLRIQKVAKLANIPEVLLRMEVRPGSISTGRRSTQVNSRIRLLLREFNWLSPRNYAGLIVNLALSLVSHSQSLTIKRFLRSLRRTSPSCEAGQ